jgi:hypothetical protein
MQVAAALQQRINALASRAHRRDRAFAPGFRVVMVYLELGFDRAARFRDLVDETPDALVPLRFRQAFASQNREAEGSPTLRLQHHEEALHITEPFGFALPHARTIGEIDIALFDDLLIDFGALILVRLPRAGSVALSPSATSLYLRSRVRYPRNMIGRPRFLPRVACGERVGVNGGQRLGRSSG